MSTCFRVVHFRHTLFHFAFSLSHTENSFDEATSKTVAYWSFLLGHIECFHIAGTFSDTRDYCCSALEAVPDPFFSIYSRLCSNTIYRRGAYTNNLLIWLTTSTRSNFAVTGEKCGEKRWNASINIFFLTSPYFCIGKFNR